MRQVLQVSLAEDEYHPALGKLLRRVGLEPSAAYTTGTQIAIANRLWIAEAFHILQPYLQLTKAYYNAEAETCQFAAQPDHERVRDVVAHGDHGGTRC